MRKTMLHLATAALASAALAAAGIAPALAHAHLLASTPAGDAAATAPEVLTLHFSEGVEPALSGVTLKGPGGVAVATGTPALAGGDPTRLAVPVTGRLGPGLYRVEWHAVAVDGHKTSGGYGFTVKP